MFTPREIQEQTFDKAVFGGYDMKQVDEFLEPLTEDYTTLYKEVSVLKSKMKILVEKIEEYRAQDTGMKKALVSAQTTADGIIAEAQKKASRILNDAEAAASAKVSDAQEKASRILSDAENAASAKAAQDQALIDTEEDRVQQAQTAAQAFIDAIESNVQNTTAQLEELRKLSRYTASANAAPKRTAAPAPAPAVEKESVEAAPAAIDDFSFDESLSSEVSDAVDAFSASHSDLASFDFTNL